MPEDVSAHLFKNFVVLLVMAAIGVDPATVPAWTSSARQQEFTAGSTTQKEDVPVLWRDPGEIEKLDFADGPGGARTRPEPPFQFIDESLTGTKAKVRVVDSHGVRWMVKFGTEVRAQTFAARLVWALGYFALPTYFVPSGSIAGVTPLKRAAKYVKPDGRFTDASFQLYLDAEVHWLSDAKSWSWTANPFVGTRQLNGLKILVMLLSDSDNKDARNRKFGSNTAILEYPSGEARYVVSDWGGAMGTWGGYLDRSNWNCIGFAVQTRDFITVAHRDVGMGLPGAAHAGLHR